MSLPRSGLFLHRGLPIYTSVPSVVADARALSLFTTLLLWTLWITVMFPSLTERL
jgi:hypothetical protein